MEEQLEQYQDPMEQPVEPDAKPEASSPSPEPEAEPTAPETIPEPEKKDGVQSRIDELTFKRREAERERDYWREAAMRQQQAEAQMQPQIQQPTAYPDLPEPKSENFDTYDAFVDARADWRTKVALRQFQDQQQSQAAQHQIRSWNDQGRSKYADWDTTFNHTGVAITPAMGQAIMSSQTSHEMAYYLGKNPQEAGRIASLSPVNQIYELGKLEARLAGPPQKTHTNAPTPTSPVGGKEVPSKKLEDMSDDEYIATRERQLGYRR